MRIKSNHNTSYLDLKLCCVNSDAPQCKEDLAVDVELFTAEGFCGKRSEVWLLSSAVDSFIAELEELEVNRHGSATLTAVSHPSEYNALELCILAADSGRTMLAEVNLQKVVFDRDRRPRPFRVSAHIEFDPEMLRKVVSDFKALFRK